MSNLKHWLLAITIPTVLVIVFYLIYSNMTVYPVKKECTYVSKDVCVVKNEKEGTIKNIDLQKFNVETSSVSIGDQVTYDVISPIEQRSKVYTVVFISALLLMLIIRFPFILYLPLAV